jgi:hypothetical protein
MAPTKTERQSRKQAENEQFEARTEQDPLGAVQSDSDAEFTADGKIPPGEETSSEYLKRIGGKKPKAPAG